jgi:hypothetical protein
MDASQRTRNVAGLALRIAGILAVAVASKIWIDEASHILTPHEGRPPVILGILMVATVIGVFGGLFWWLYLSPLKVQVEPDNSDSALRRRRLVGAVMLVGSGCFVVGGMMDTLWHMWLGSFGDDFLWLPHKILYGSFLLDTIVAGVVLGRIVLGGGDPRVRARREPALGLMALASAYVLFSAPSDLVWHQIYGRDITPWSLPHILLVTTVSFACVAGASLLLASLRPGERNALVRTGVILFVACAVWTWLMLITPEYEFSNSLSGAAFAVRPTWVYPLAVYIVGLTGAVLITSMLDMPWAATAVAMVVLLGRLGLAWGATTLPIDRTFKMASSAFLILPAIGLDLALARLGHLTRRQRVLRGSLVYWAIYWPVALVATTAMQIGMPITVADGVVGMAIGLGFLFAFAVGIPTVVRYLHGRPVPEVQSVQQSAVPSVAAGD